MAFQSQDPAIPVMSNVTAREMTAGERVYVRPGGADSVAGALAPVDHRMQESGVDKFTEIGPGRALITMLKRDAPDATLVSLDGSAVLATPTNV